MDPEKIVRNDFNRRRMVIGNFNSNGSVMFYRGRRQRQILQYVVLFSGMNGSCTVRPCFGRGQGGVPPQRPAARKPYLKGKIGRQFPGLNMDPVLAGQSRQSAGIALAYRSELPFAAVPVNLSENHRGLDGGVFA